MRSHSFFLVTGAGVLALAAAHLACDGTVLTNGGQAVTECGHATCDAGKTPDASPADAAGPNDAGPYVDATGSDAPATDGSSVALDCTTAVGKAARWAQMIKDPIVPPGMAGIYFDSGHALTLEEAEKINCKGDPIDAGDPTLNAVAWGQNHEVEFYYRPSDQHGHQLVGNPGYAGTMTFHGRKTPDAVAGHCWDYTQNPPVDTAPTCKHASDVYEMRAGGAITKNGIPFTIDWTDAVGGDYQITELYDAAIATFMPSLKSDADCGSNALDGSLQCLNVADDGQGSAYLGFRPLVVYFTFPVGTSTPNLVYDFIALDAGL